MRNKEIKIVLEEYCNHCGADIIEIAPQSWVHISPDGRDEFEFCLNSLDENASPYQNCIEHGCAVEGDLPYIMLDLDEEAEEDEPVLELRILTLATQNSVYELDQANHSIRRIRGNHPPNPEQGHDWEWQAYENIFVNGFDGLFIIWEDDEPAYTTTTQVSHMSEELASIINCQNRGTT